MILLTQTQRPKPPCHGVIACGAARLMKHREAERMSSRSGSRGNYLCTVDWSTNPLPLSHANGILRRGKSLKGFCGQTLKGLGKLGHASLWRRHSRSQIFMSHSRSHSPPPLTSLQCCDDYENVRAVSASSSSIPDAIKRRRDEDEEEKISQQNASHKI